MIFSPRRRTASLELPTETPPAPRGRLQSLRSIDQINPNLKDSALSFLASSLLTHNTEDLPSTSVPYLAYQLGIKGSQSYSEPALIRGMIRQGLRARVSMLGQGDVTE